MYGQNIIKYVADYNIESFKFGNFPLAFSYFDNIMHIHFKNVRTEWAEQFRPLFSILNFNEKYFKMNEAKMKQRKKEWLQQTNNDEEKKKRQ